MALVQYVLKDWGLYNDNLQSTICKYCIAKVDLGNENFQKLSGLPGFKKWLGREMMFDPTGANIDYIYKFWPDAQWSDDVQEILTKYVDAKKEASKK